MECLGKDVNRMVWGWDGLGWLGWKGWCRLEVKMLSLVGLGWVKL